MNNLSVILSKCQRKTSWGLVDDPIAQDILKSPYFTRLEQSINSLNLPPLSPLGFGTFHLVLSAGNNIIRLGLGTIQERPDISEVLQPTIQEQIGTLKYEIMPKADTLTVNEQHLEDITNSLREQGYAWGDAGLDNIGLIEGKPVIIDSDGIRQLKTKNTLKIK